MRERGNREREGGKDRETDREIEKRTDIQRDIHRERKMSWPKTRYDLTADDNPTI